MRTAAQFGQLEPPTAKDVLEPPTVKAMLEPPTAKTMLEPPTAKAVLEPPTPKAMPRTRQQTSSKLAHPGSDLRHLRSRRHVGWILPLQSHVTIACSGAAKAAAKAAVSQAAQHPPVGYLVRCGVTTACTSVGTELCRKQHGVHSALCWRAGRSNEEQARLLLRQAVLNGMNSPNR